MPPERPDSAIASARARAHADVRAEIVASAMRQIAEKGAASLSLRAVARDLGVVSSAIYRYFPSRDALLTALIIESYDELGDRVETSVRATVDRPPLERWVDAALTIRRWAMENPHDYALVYGSPVPGYAAPSDTVDPGVRASRALVSIVRDAITAGTIDPARAGDPTISAATATALDALQSALGVEARHAVLLAVIAAWTQLFGLISFELFGQTHGLTDDHEAMFRDAITAMAERIGL
jgi:AcrR family transcriptional regulator